MIDRRTFLSASALAVTGYVMAGEKKSIAAVMPNSDIINEKPRSTPVVQTCDVCVLGGSCTGVFAAVRAAQMGAKVALIEKQNAFGGVATSGLVATWTHFKDRKFNRTIIGGLTKTMIDRLTKFKEPRGEFYQIPLSTMVSKQAENVIMAGRMISTDRAAFGGIRVMVNLNQVGEAAGVTAAMAASGEKAVSTVDAASVRDQLSKLGAVII